MKKKNRIIPLIGVIAAGLVIALSLQTETGSAFIKGAKDMFDPKKKLLKGEGQDRKPTFI